MGITVSVIIPMYNVSELIEPCINSLYSQSFRNLELIFVDDCSTDGSLNKVTSLIDELSPNGIEYKIISHEVNRGVAAARNTGLEHASGKYIYYVDSDDFIDTNAIERLVTKAEETDSDIVSCEWMMEFGKNARHLSQPEASTGEELFKKMAYGVFRWNLWLFLVKRSLYSDNGILFIEGVNMGEDMMVMLKLAACADKVAVIHSPMYHYIQTNINAISKDIRPYIGQIKDNVREVEDYIHRKFGDEFDGPMTQLKLSLKLPLLISDKKTSYVQWLEWWPETNSERNGNPEISWRTRLLQNAVCKNHFFILKLYYWCIIKVIYGVIYK